MNNAQWRYFALNQFLCGREFATLPPAAKDVMARHEGQWVDCQTNLSQVKLDKIVRLFVNLLRVPFYTMCSSQNSRVLLMEQIVSTVRNKDIDMRQCKQWAPSAIVSVELTDIGTPTVRDGVLYLPGSIDPGTVDLNGALEYAFYLRCWGTDSPNVALKELVRLLVSWATPKEDIVVSDDDVSHVFDLMLAGGVHPTTLVKTALIISDLAPAIAETGGICWWKNFDQERVSVMLPRGKGNTLSCALFTRKEFLDAIKGGTDVLSRMRVQGSRILVEG